MKILIVDDSEYMQSLLEDIILDQGFLCKKVSDATQMLAMVNDYQPDVAIIDIVMPGLNGIDAIKILHKEQPGIKIIVCSALQVPQIKDQAIENGASAFIQKPFGVDSVMNAIKESLQF